jgi:LuxR family transcriptional regulator, quorum-sensing system regulator SdiA
MLKMEGINHWLEVLKEKASAGYAIGLHIEYNAPKVQFESYPVEWVNHYEEKGFFLQDPVVMWGFQNQGTRRWSELAGMDVKGVFDDAKSFGMNYGFVASIEVNGKHSIAGFARPDREFTDSEIIEICEIFKIIHNDKMFAIKLTDKEKVLLNALSNGARIEEAASDLGIPIVTVKAQLTKVRSLLGTRTSAEAVQRAVDLGLLK